MDTKIKELRKMTYTVKRERIEKAVREEALRRAEEERERAEGCMRILRRMIAALMVIFAVIFGELITAMSAVAVFCVVFVYLATVGYLWLK